MTISSQPRLSLSRFPCAVVGSSMCGIRVGKVSTLGMSLVLGIVKMAMVLSLLVLEGLLLGLLLGDDLFRGSIEKQINHHVPLLASWDRSSEIQDLSGEQPEDETDGFGGAVVARDHNVDVLDGRV